MKKLIVTGAIFCLFCALGINAKVLVVVDRTYYYANQANVDRYISDVKNYDSKQVDLQLLDDNERYFQTTVHENCERLWTIIRDEYQNSYNASTPDSCLEGVVLVGALPVAWSDVGGEFVPDDRYFMDICDASHACYTSDADVWDFDTSKNMFTNYHGDTHMDIWVSRIRANEIRGLRDSSTDVMDEYTIINNYFTRVHERMTQPAKVPPRAFVMGGISEWGDHDPLTKFGFTNLNLNQVYKFDFPDNRPANWLLQLVWGPYGGTTRGAFNGTRYPDVTGQNSITKTWPQLYDYKNNVSVNITSTDTMGYEWAGLYEHSLFRCHVFNQDENNESPFGSFNDVTLAPQWTNNISGSGYYNNGAYIYNPTTLPNPYNAIGWSRGIRAIFKAKIPAGAGGIYNIYVSYPADSSNCSYVYGYINSWPWDYNFGGSELCGKTWAYGFGNPGDSQQSTSNTTCKYLKPIDMTKHTNTLHGYPNFECIVDSSGALGSFDFTGTDTAWIDLSADFNNLIADAVKLVPVDGVSLTITIDNLDAGFASNNWYDRSFLDMQDEDTVYHRSISKVPFIVSSGCDVGDYMGCYDAGDTLHYTLGYPYWTPVNCLGLLYGMAHSGLVGLTSAISYPGYSVNLFSPLTTCLAGKDSRGLPNTFGDGVLAQYNTTVSSPNTYTWMQDWQIPLTFIGAGTLRPDPNAYVKYGTQEVTIANQNISNTVTYSNAGKLVWMQDLNVTSTGNVSVAGTEVRIYAESDLQGVVDIKAQ